MKFASRDDRSAVSTGQLTLALAVATLLPLLLYGSAPSWWSQRGVLVQDSTPDDYAPVNQGQLKNIAQSAVAEMDAKLTGGAGDELHALIQSWASADPATNDFAPVNLGQIKDVARLFFDRLISAGIVDHYPWQVSLNFPDDFAVGNLGQVKSLFSFGIPVANLIQDPLGDRIAAGHHSANLALQIHAVWIWGDRLSGDGDFQRNYPRRISELSSISCVAAGERHLVALQSDGSVWTWGESALGQLGDGTFANRAAPGTVPHLANIVSVKAGGLHTLALHRDGTVHAWGDNYYGQLGIGDRTGSATPKTVTGLDNVHKIAAGYQRSIALRNDGTVWTWGYDHYTGQDIFNTSPIAVPELSDVIGVAAGYEHSIAMKADGTVWAWGSNYANQIGNASSRGTFQAIPVQVPNLSNIAKVASSYDHSLALAADGTVWAWGDNFSGQLGDGTNQARQTPVRVSGLTDVVSIATARSHSLAMKADGSIWAWGDSATGALPGADLHVPQLVGLGVVDSNDNEIDDRWEKHFLGSLDQSGDADFDGDGISNRHEYLRGSDPGDYFNGVTPVIEIASGNNQIGDPGTLLIKPFKIRIRNPGGQLLANAPLTFSTVGGGGALVSSAGGAQQQSLSLRTNLNGEAAVYHVLPNTAGISTRTIATAGTSAALTSATFRGIVRFSLPSPSPSATPTPNPDTTPTQTPSPTSTPPPDPNTTPTPTPSPTASPFAPYRYAVIDLGKNLSPLRVNNKGWILLVGEANGQWGYFRWKGGELELLTYNGSPYTFEAVDMNDEGIVVGTFFNDAPWVNNAENERWAGLTWAANSSQAVKTAAPVAYRTWGFLLSGTIKKASFKTVNNKNEIFGEVRTGGGHGYSFTPFDIVNAYHWLSGAATPLSFGMATYVEGQSDPPKKFIVSGESDSVSRANGDGRYIGSKFRLVSVGTPLPLNGIRSGMIDGMGVDFAPVDINEGGIVVGNTPNGGAMIIKTLVKPPQVAPPNVSLPGVAPIAINDHVRPAPKSDAPASPLPSPSPIPRPIPVPQILGWAGNAVALLERQEDGKTWHPFGLEEMIPNMEGWQYLEPYDMNNHGAIVGRGWYTDPSVPNAAGEYHAFLLVPVELMVDGNRDGEMWVHKSTLDATNEQNPYRFWVNDDQDNVRLGMGPTSYGDGETSPATSPNFNDPHIRTARDLEDWSRLWISFAGIIDLVKNSDVTVELILESSEEQPVIKLCRAVEPNGGRRYLTDLSTAASQLNGDFGLTHGPLSNTAPLDLKSGVRGDWLNDLTERDSKLHLLFEGTSKGRGKLKLHIKKGGRVIMRSQDLFIDLKSVRNMYERGKITLDAPQISNPWDNDRPAPLQWAWDPWNWPPELDPWANGQTIIYVHGWRMTYDEYLSWADTTFKRLFQLGYKGKFFSFHWPTFNGDNNGVNPLDLFVPGGTTYNPSEYRAWLSGPTLASFVNELPNPDARYLIAHSMGNVTAGAALRNGMHVTQYAMCNSAMAAMAYDGNSTDYNYETPDTDVDIGTRQTFGLANKLNPTPTEIVNFSLPADYALGQWSANNEYFKPQPRIGYSYHYRSYNPAGLKLTYEGVISVRPITSEAEAMGFVTRSRSAAAGAKQSTRGSISSFVNMGQGGFEFGTEHSAEWVYSLQRTFPFWKEVLKKFDIDIDNSEADE